MKGYTSETIRNVALLGHGGCGKTTFLESALFETGVIKKLGKVDDGNTVSDYDKMEIEKGYSINTSVVPIEWKDSKINFIDTPGYFDFVGEVNAAMRAAEAAVGREHVVDSKPCLASEDFAVFGEVIPSFFYWVGSGTPGMKCASWHDPAFRVDPRYTETAVPVLCASVLTE